MTHRPLVILVFLLITIASIEAQTSSNIRRDQQRNRKQIEQAERDVKNNVAAVESNLRQLELLDGQVRDINADVRRLRGKSDSIMSLIRPLNDSITDLSGRLENMRQKYQNALRKSQINANSMNDLTFIFSAESFMQAWQRYRSLKQFSRWRGSKASEILDTRASLQLRKQRLDSLRMANNRVLKQVEERRNVIEQKRVETDRIVKSLKSQNKQLQKVLKRRRDEARKLEERLERAIAEEMEQRRREEERQRKEELKRQQQTTGNSNSSSQPSATRPTTQNSTAPTVDARLSGSFESNKGELPYPVKGEYTIVKKFGRQKHPRLPKVETDNPGIDIEASKGAAVYAVFDGEVSQIFKLAGYNNVIVLRHGNYVTVYANVDVLKVKKGDKVTTGQQLGTLFIDKNDGNRSILHFELRREKEKENPELWLK